MVPSHTSKENYGKLAQSAPCLLAPDDRRRLAELDYHAVQTREDVYQAFELLDTQRHDLELARVHNQPHPSEAIVSRPVVQVQIERSMATFPPHQRIQAATAHSLPEKAKIQPEKSSSAFPSTYVESDQGWHFDSLREVLQTELSKLPVETHGREVWQPCQADHDLLRDH